MAEYIMTDCNKTLDFFAAWKRLCKAQHGTCGGCPLSGALAGSIFTCQRFAFEQPAEAVRIVQAWVAANPAPTWEDKLRELLPSADMEQVVSCLCPGELFGEPGLSRLHCKKDADCRACWQREYAEGK